MGGIVLFILALTIFSPLRRMEEIGPAAGFLQPLFIAIGIFLLLKGGGRFGGRRRINATAAVGAHPCHCACDHRAVEHPLWNRAGSLYAMDAVFAGLAKGIRGNGGKTGSTLGFTGASLLGFDWRLATPGWQLLFPTLKIKRRAAHLH